MATGFFGGIGGIGAGWSGGGPGDGGAGEGAGGCGPATPGIGVFTVAVEATRGAIIAFSTLVEPHSGQATSERLLCLS